GGTFVGNSPTSNGQATAATNVPVSQGPDSTAGPIQNFTRPLGTSPGAPPAPVVPGSPIFTQSQPSFVDTTGANVTGLHGTQADLVGTTFDGNHDGIPDAGQDDVADIRAINGQTVVLEARGHELTNIQVLAAPAGQNAALPLGMFGFRVH